ncbi:holocarboxylase synthetase 2 [Hibiscus syriacus]|uniref:Holocarboxylase synthetase 2 n=1 Tax=Hibiscus syriacus TaxID=106335 RepID=A0A6A3BT94_HIBSY|nr:protein terminal ear1 homolog [Hibiscus syriacus]KAE8718668.1 holocarboxylase synthetase 2 [Hibiscus syriacus]
MQPFPWSGVLNGTNYIQYNEINYSYGRIVGRKKRSKRRFLPPRLKSARQYPIPMHSQQVRVKKSDAEKTKASSDHFHVTAEEQPKLHGNTSVMIKNIPNSFQRIDLQRKLDDHCRTENTKAQPGSYFCKSAYDFLYLQMDFGFHLNLGFAFVNFTSPIAASRFYRAWNNREWRCGDSRKKVCEIDVAKFQGKDELKEKLQDSVFRCHTNEYLPVVYSPARDGFNNSGPRLVGRQSHDETTTSKDDDKVMIMARRKNRKQV